MAKDIFEDRKRHRFDKEENNRDILVFDRERVDFVETKWKNLKVG